MQKFKTVEKLINQLKPNEPIYCIRKKSIQLASKFFLNKFPAKLFMGDSGSLAIGASLGGIALISNNLLSLLIMGGILAAESISVIVQVSIFKISKKIKGKGHKLFLMTPIHHHFELQGNNETVIVSSFWFVTLLLVIINIKNS